MILKSRSHLNPFSTNVPLMGNQVVGFYLQNVWKTPVEEWHQSCCENNFLDDINKLLNEVSESNTIVTGASENNTSSIWGTWMRYKWGIRTYGFLEEKQLPPSTK